MGPFSEHKSALLKRPQLSGGDGLCIQPPSEPTWHLPPFDDFVLTPYVAASLRVVTWNVWFSPLEADERMAALFTEALGASPDVLCLQEVVPRLANAIHASALRNVYAISPNTIDSYGCLLLVRRTLAPTFCEIALPSRMGRTLLVAEWASPSCSSPVAVATVHLESLNNAAARAKQLRVAYNELRVYEQVLLCGDFNFDATRNFGDWLPVPPRPPRPSGDSDSDDEEPYSGPLRQAAGALENDVLSLRLPGYTDAWPALHGPLELGHTFDGARNPRVRDPEEQMRYDRVMVRGAHVSNIWLLGTGDSRAAAIVPSDHYGLCADVELPQPPTQGAASQPGGALPRSEVK